MKNLIIVGVVAILLVFGGSYLAGNSGDKGELISQNGIHWHPTLKITIHGEEQEIPPNLGLIGAHNPMHTHETDGVIHLEYGNAVYEDDIRLGEFFKLWRKEFSSTQIFDTTGEVRMLVNGEVNTEYENYILQDADVVELILE